MDKKSAVSRKPSSQNVEDFIGKGLTVVDNSSTGNVEGERVSEDTGKLARVQLRLSKSKLQEIDALLSQRKVKVSRHVWLLEAIQEKLEKDFP